jgi:DNA-directed RNA polymerase subunit RPC12/RpoP
MKKCAACGRVIKVRTHCSTCRSRILKKKNPVYYFFNLLKVNATRRGIEFVLTLNQFKDFCVEVDFIKKKGKKITSLTIDRIRADRGYHIDNIQALPLAFNSKKVVYDHYAERKFSVKNVNNWGKPPPPHRHKKESE